VSLYSARSSRTGAAIVTETGATCFGVFCRDHPDRMQRTMSHGIRAQLRGEEAAAPGSRNDTHRLFFARRSWCWILFRRACQGVSKFAMLCRSGYETGPRAIVAIVV